MNPAMPHIPRYFPITEFQTDHVLSAALFLLSALSFACGILLSSINRRSAEIAALLPSK